MRPPISRLTALCCALAIALTDCRLPAGGGSEAGPPAGGWPRPSGDRVTRDMCGLLTDADYKKLGHERRPRVSGSVDDHDNTVDCRYRSGDELTLTLEPTADFAHYVFAAGLKDHKARLARRSGLVGDVIGAADESWFDLPAAAQSGPAAHELRLRRGSLILGITLGGTRGRTEKDPRSVLIALSGLVLRRLRRPEWGKGYATEGSRALIRKGFTELAVERVVAETLTVNAGSRRVLEKAGLTLVRTFHRDGLDAVDGSEHGVVEYALTRAGWERTRREDG